MKKTLKLCVILWMIFLFPLSVMGAGTKAEAKRSIAIVFDNSGSMYQYTENGVQVGNKAWCQATYAMQVFASMMNDHDTVSIYPMHEIEVSGQIFDMHNPMQVQGSRQAEAIQNIYTPDAGGTPFEPITAAFDDIKDAEGERWLILLTDGDTFENLGQEETKSKLEELLGSYIADTAHGVNIMYLGIGATLTPPELPTGVYHAKESSEVPSLLAEMANVIYGRDILQHDSKYFRNGKDIYTDVDLSKAIVFVQGRNISNVKLVDASGNVCIPNGDDYNLHYAERGSKNRPMEEVDDTLTGIMTIYSDLPAGEYQLQFDGNESSVDVYYEPDVDLDVYLTSDEEGKDRVTDFYPQEYYLQWGIVDKNGSPVDSELLGNVSYDVAYSLNGAQQGPLQTPPQKISLAKDTKLDVEATVQYLSGYSIAKSTEDFSWLKDFQVTPFPVEDLGVAVDSDQKEFYLNEVENAVYPVEITYGGAVLTGEDLDRCRLEVAKPTQNNVSFEVQRGDKGWQIVPKFENDPSEADLGDYSISVQAVYENEHGDEVTASSDETTLTIQPYPIKDLAVSLEPSESEYYPNELEKVAYTVKVTYDGKELTKEELERCTVELVQETQNNLQFAIDKSSSPWKITVSPIQPVSVSDVGEYKIQVNASYVNEYDKEVAAESKEAALTLKEFPAGELLASVEPTETEYTLPELDEVAYEVKVLYEGKALTEEELERCEIKVQQEVQNHVKFEVVKENGKCLIKATGLQDMTASDAGEYPIAVDVTYTDEYGQKMTTESPEVPLTLTSVSHELKLKMTGGPKKTLIKDLADSDPYVIKATWDGEQLTEAQLAELCENAVVDAKGMTYTLTPDPANSALTLQLTGIEQGQTLKPGTYSIDVQSMVHDELQSEITAEDSASFKLLKYPEWVKWVIIAIVILVLLLLLLLIMSRKAFPRGIVLGDATFTAHGVHDDMPGNFSVNYPRTRKRRNLTITAPANVECTAMITLTVTPLSRRWTRSASRLLQVQRVSISPIDRGELTVSGIYEFSINDQGVLEGVNEGSSIILRNGDSCSMMARYMDERGRNRIVTMDVRFEFR